MPQVKGVQSNSVKNEHYYPLPNVCAPKNSMIYYRTDDISLKV